MVQSRARLKNMIHGILLHESIKIHGLTFAPTFVRVLHGLNDWRIEEYLKGIDSINECISGRADFRINSYLDMA